MNTKTHTLLAAMLLSGAVQAAGPQAGTYQFTYTLNDNAYTDTVTLERGSGGFYFGRNQYGESVVADTASKNLCIAPRAAYLVTATHCVPVGKKRGAAVATLTIASGDMLYSTVKIATFTFQRGVINASAVSTLATNNQAADAWAELNREER